MHEGQAEHYFSDRSFDISATRWTVPWLQLLQMYSVWVIYLFQLVFSPGLFASLFWPCCFAFDCWLHLLVFLGRSSQQWLDIIFWQKKQYVSLLILLYKNNGSVLYVDNFFSLYQPTSTNHLHHGNPNMLPLPCYQIGFYHGQILIVTETDSSLHRKPMCAKCMKCKVKFSKPDQFLQLSNLPNRTTRKHAKIIWEEFGDQV